MDSDFKVRFDLEKLKMMRSWVEVDSPAEGALTLEVEGENVLVRGDLAAGSVIVGARSIIVEGMLRGEEGNGCHLEAERDVAIGADVQEAHIDTRSIFVVGEVAGGCLEAGEKIEIGGDVDASRLSLGESRTFVEEWEDLKKQTARAGVEQETVKKQIGHYERRLGGLCQTTHIALHFSLGEIIHQDNERVSVDLQPLYKTMTGKNDAEVDAALRTFFAKGVAGYLAKANQKYIASNTTHRKAFVQILGDMSRLFILVYKRDRLDEEVSGRKTAIDQLIEQMQNGERELSVQGWILAGSEIKFIEPTVVLRTDGEVAFTDQNRCAVLNVQPSVEGMGFVAERRDRSGEYSATILDDAGLQQVALRLHEGQIVWDGLAVQQVH